MADLSRYYQRDPIDHGSSSSERFPQNHVQFSPLLKPIQWLDSAYGWFGTHAFPTRAALLKEFDKAAPLDECLGTKEELVHIRQLLELYGREIDNNPYLSSVGRFLTKKISLNLLENRKKVLRYYHENRTFIEANGKLKAPVIIAGLPRSGTTLLQRLMSEDPNTRSPYSFEMEVPTPPLTCEADPLEDPRIKTSGTSMNVLSRLAPGFLETLAESHLMHATEMEESLIYMLAHNGIYIMASVTAGNAYLDECLKAEGKRPVFRYERLFFTMLDAYRPAPSHWTLKAPVYAPFFPTIFEEYPDARVVVTHRNPVVVLPSVCRLMESWNIAFDKDGSLDKHRMAALIQGMLKRYALVPLQFRKDQPEKEEQIFDCMYADLFADPVAMVKKIYAKFGLEYTTEFEERMKVYLETNKQGKYGRHQYSLEEYGLSAEKICQDYEAYMNAYGFGRVEKTQRPVALDSGFALG